LNAAWFSGDMMNSIASRATWTSRLGVAAAVADVEASSRGDSSRGMSDCECECECEIAISDGSDGDAGGDGV
jgi:hypothetical protein